MRNHHGGEGTTKSRLSTVTATFQDNGGECGEATTASMTDEAIGASASQDDAHQKLQGEAGENGSSDNLLHTSQRSGTVPDTTMNSRWPLPYPKQGQALKNRSKGEV
jgi:hypothetical protein